MKKNKKNITYAVISFALMFALMSSVFLFTTTGCNGCDACVHGTDTKTLDFDDSDNPSDHEAVIEDPDDGRVRLVRVDDYLMHPATGLDVIKITWNEKGRAVFTDLETGEKLRAIIDSERERYIYFSDEKMWVIPVLDDDDPTLGGNTPDDTDTKDDLTTPGPGTQPPNTTPGYTTPPNPPDDVPRYTGTVTIGNTEAQTKVNADPKDIQVYTNRQGVQIIQIRRPGEYTIKGKSGKAGIAVGSNDGFPGGTVTLTLDGVELTNPTGPAIRTSKLVDKLILNLKGTSTVRDTRKARPDEDERDAIEEALGDDESNPFVRHGAIFTNDCTLEISGKGKLIVHAGFAHGIATRGDMMTIKGGANVQIASAHAAGLRATRSVTIDGATLDIKTNHKGIRAAGNQHGNIIIRNSTVKINTPKDGFHAQVNVTLQKSTIDMKVGGGWKEGRHPVQGSRVGIRATGNVNINGGKVTIQAADHGINSSEIVQVIDATLNVEASQRGVRGRHGILLKNSNVTVGISNIALHGGSVPGKSRIIIEGGKVSVHYIQTAINANVPNSAQITGLTYSECLPNCPTHR
ncbi:MAG: carbohydrate-binding domain-containing protein [Oscillospiraceae bacterium]|nr:carbohydrate-binding domain-containing protein [Oscillospiraceae bacterium]